MESALGTEKSCSNHALSLISESTLEYPNKHILETFIKDAVDSELAARYLLQTVGSVPGVEDGTSEAVRLSCFLTNWTTLVNKLRPEECKVLARTTRAAVRARDGYRCCVTGLEPSFFEEQLIVACIVPPSALVFLRMPSNGSLKDMLEAFITPAGWDSLYSLLEPFSSSRVPKDTGPEPGLDNLWLLSTGVYGAFREGEIHLRPRADDDPFAPLHPPGCLVLPSSNPSNIEAASLHHQSYNIVYSCVVPRPYFYGPKHVMQPKSITLCNQALALSPLPNSELFKFHARISKAMKWTAVSENVKKGWPPGKKGTIGLDKLFFYFLKHIWTRLPSLFRSRTYGLLRKLGQYLYGAQAAGTQKLPFNLYLKTGDPSGLLNQARAMDLVECHTEMPAPRVIDEIYNTQKSYLLMTAVPGTPLGPLLHRLSDAEVTQAAEDLKRHLSQLRRIPNLFSPQSIICSAAGQGLYDYRINSSCDRNDFKFASEAEFNECLLSDVPKELHEKATVSHSIRHQIVFTHGDLNMRNILMEKGRISAIVDWENAGWFPEYWEFTKVHYTIFYTKRYLDDIIEKALGGYEKELEIEKMLFRYVDPF